MAETKSEYLVGNIKPTDRPGVAGDPQLNDELPAAIKIVGLNMNFTRGNEDEFGASMPAYEEKVKELADMGADLIRPGGAPPFMMLGYQGEDDLLSGWEKKYGVPMFTSGKNHARALRALGVKRFVGASYFPKKLNDVLRVIRGYSVSDAVVQCALSPKKYADVVRKVILSAAANATNNHDLDRDKLYVAEAIVGKGTFLPRVSIHGRGRSGKMHRPRSHVTIIVEEREAPPKKSRSVNIRDTEAPWKRHRRKAMHRYQIAAQAGLA